MEREKRALRTLAEKTESFIIEDKNGENVELKLYPLQLARLVLISEKLLGLDLVFDESNEDNPVKAMWQICATKARDVAEIIAIATLPTKEQIEEQLKERTDLIFWSPTMTPNAYANLLYYIVLQSYYGDFIKAIRSVKTLQVRISQDEATERIAMEGEASGDK